MPEPTTFETCPLTRGTRAGREAADAHVTDDEVDALIHARLDSTGSEARQKAYGNVEAYKSIYADGFRRGLDARRKETGWLYPGAVTSDSPCVCGHVHHAHIIVRHDRGVVCCDGECACRAFRKAPLCVFCARDGARVHVIQGKCYGCGRAPSEEWKDIRLPPLTPKQTDCITPVPWREMPSAMQKHRETAEAIKRDAERYGLEPASLAMVLATEHSAPAHSELTCTCTHSRETHAQHNARYSECNAPLCFCRRFVPVTRCKHVACGCITKAQRRMDDGPAGVGAVPPPKAWDLLTDQVRAALAVIGKRDEIHTGKITIMYADLRVDSLARNIDPRIAASMRAALASIRDALRVAVTPFEIPQRIAALGEAGTRDIIAKGRNVARQVREFRANGYGPDPERDQLVASLRADLERTRKELAETQGRLIVARPSPLPGTFDIDIPVSAPDFACMEMMQDGGTFALAIRDPGGRPRFQVRLRCVGSK